MKNDTTPPRPAFAAKEGTLRIRNQPLFYRRLAPRRKAADARPTMVFLHEGLGCTAMWRDFPGRVGRATGLEVVSYDRAGYGRSPLPPHARTNDYLHREAEDVLPRLLARLGIECAVLVGHSDGGSIALLAAAACPERIAGIVTEAAHVFVERVTLQGIRDTVAAYAPRRLEERLSRYHGAKARHLFFAWADTWLSDSFRDWNIESCLGRIRCPALVIQGHDDAYGSEEQVRAIVAGIGPRARAMLLPHCGHAPHRDAPETVVDAIQAFAAALPAGANAGREKPPA